METTTRSTMPWATEKKVVFVASAGNGQGDPAVGFNVNDLGASSFYHPCIEDHVICVGALVPGGVHHVYQYSNFGDQVLIFAPTDILVYVLPADTGYLVHHLNKVPQPSAAVLRRTGHRCHSVFGGTSASAPFVAGVIAMMKAVNPELDHDAVAQILRDTARPGVAPANRVLDAYAAVRRAAGVSAIVKDALENNDLETIPDQPRIAPALQQDEPEHRQGRPGLLPLRLADRVGDDNYDVISPGARRARGSQSGESAGRLRNALLSSATRGFLRAAGAYSPTEFREGRFDLHCAPRM